MDSDRSAVYAAEDQVRRMIALADETMRREVEFGSTTLVLPPERKFGDREGVQRFVDAVLDSPSVRDEFGTRGAITVRDRKGAAKATYSSGVISIPASSADGRWAMCETVVLHEVAHHFAPGAAHGPEFREAFATLCGIVMAPEVELLLRAAFAGERFAGSPSGAAEPAAIGSDTLRKIGALLAKAESTDNEAEAEAYLAKAQELATRYSIDLAVARQVAKDRLSPAAAPAPIQRTMTIGVQGKRINKHLIALYVGIARPNDVRINIAHNSTYVIAFGFEADIDVVDALFASAVAVMVDQANRYVRGRSWENTTYLAAVGTRHEAIRPVTSAVARTAFYQGFTERLGQRLSAARREAVAEAERAESERSGGAMFAGTGSMGKPADSRDDRALVSVALALRAKTGDVDAFYQRTSKARGSWSGYQGSAGTARDSLRAGRAAADRVRLGASEAISGKSGQIGA